MNDASPSDRLLLDAFIRHRRAQGTALIAVNDRTWIATPSARKALAEYDHETVWRHVEQSLRTRRPVQIGGRDGRVVTLDLREELTATAAIVAVSSRTLSATGVPARLAPSPLGEMVGQSAAWHHVVQHAAAAARMRQPIIIQGEFGTGRCTIAEAIAGRAGSDRVVFDAGKVALVGSAQWLRSIAEALDEPQVIIVRDADLLDDRSINALTSLARDSHLARMIITLASDEADSQVVGRLRSVVPVSISVPPLRARPEDIEPIARKHLASQGRTSVSDQFFVALQRRAWTGNVWGLLASLDSALDAARHRPLQVQHLPPDSGGGGASITGTIRQAEDAVIRRALTQANGNRTEAAELLGISRATLYRRLRTYGID